MHPQFDESWLSSHTASRRYTNADAWDAPRRSNETACLRAVPLANQGELLTMHRAEVRGYDERFAAGCLAMRPVITGYGLSVE
jgi:hypothetical protein